MSLSSATTDEIVKKVRQGLGYTILHQYGLVRVTGKDAATFLHAQTTHDVNQLQTSQGHATALLDRKAHIQAYMSLHRLGNTFWLLVEKDQITRVLEHLNTYHFTEDVQMVSCADDFRLFTIQGPESVRWMQQALSTAPMPTGENAIWEETAFFDMPALVICKTLTGEIGYIIAVAGNSDVTGFQQRLETLGQIFDMVPMSAEVLEVLRIEAGIPRYGIDMDAETLLPETGLEQVAVSYTKGCYLGQEVIARIKTYGSVQKALVGLTFPQDQSVPPLHAQMLQADKVIGTIKSGVFSPTLNVPVAMAYLAREYRIPHKTLAFTAEGKSYQATVTWLPFYTAPDANLRAKAKYDQALQLFAQDREEQAILLLREALELAPHLADAYEALGVILSRRQDYDEAIALMHKLAEIDPDSVMAHTNLSMFYMKKGMKEQAEAEKEKATMLGFKKAMVQRQTQQALEEKIRMFQEVLALDAEDALANYGLGSTYLQLQRYQEAVPLLEKATQLDPKYTVAYLALGKTYQALHNAEKARETYAKGIEVAAKRGDLMPLQEMQRCLAAL